MKDATQKLMLPGLVWLATAAALPGVAQDRSPAEPRSARPSAVPQANGPSSTLTGSPVVAAPTPNSPIPVTDFPTAEDCEVECPPRRLGPIGRWRQRCRAHAQDKCCGYPEEFVDAPMGGMLQGHIAASIARGQAARMVLHQFDFFPASDQLKPRGKMQVAKIGEWAAMNPFFVLVEPSGIDPALDEARRQTVWHELASGPWAFPLDRVVVGYGPSRGLGGVEAQAIDLNRLNLTVSRGSGGGSGATSGGASGSSSGGSGGATVAR